MATLPLFVRQHLIELPILAVEAFVAWVCPMRVWRRVSLAFAGASSRLRRASLRRRVRAIESQLSGQPLAGSGASIARSVRAGEIEARLHILRHYRRGGWRPKLKLHGREHLEAALARGRGVILWAGNFVMSDLPMLRVLSLEGYAITRLSGQNHGLSGDHRSRLGRRLNRVQTRIEDRYLAARVKRPLDGGFAYLRTLEQRLAENGIVWIRAYDEGPGTRAVPFLNGSMQLTTGPAVLAASTGASLLPAFVERLGHNAWKCTLEPALSHTSTGEATHSADAMVTRFSELLEARISRAPGTWLSWGQFEESGGKPEVDGLGSQMPERGPLIERIGHLLRRTLGVELEDSALVDDTGLLGQGIGLDSVEVLQLVSALEEEFDLTLEDEELAPEHFRTLGALARFVEGKRNA